jgi:hypothetical protein
MCFALRVMRNSIATEISVSLEHKNLASDDQNSNKTAPEEAFSCYRRNLSMLVR